MSFKIQEIFEDEGGYLTDDYGEQDTSFEVHKYEKMEALDDILPLMEDLEIKTVKKSKISPRMHFLECVYQFISGVKKKKKAKRISAMANYHYFATISEHNKLPYPNAGMMECGRLELESEMLCVSHELYEIFLANLSELKMDWLIQHHSIKERPFSESNITSLMYESYAGKYVCISEGRSISVWYFGGTRWMEISSAEIWQDISTNFIEFVHAFGSSYIGKVENWKDLCTDVARYLSSVASRERIQRDLLYRLTNEGFRSKLNSNLNLIGMSNGVYDTEKGKLRMGLPMDYISMSTRIDYSEDDDEELLQSLKQILRTIFPNKKVRKFFIQSCASLLEGRNKDKFVYIWWGKGNNGKSMMEKLISHTFGEYAMVAATSLVTGKRSSADGPNPQLAMLEGKLVAFLQEPNPNETIKIGMVKELSGNDDITARGLFKNPRTFAPKFKLVIVCNNAVEIPNIDRAFRQRLIVIPFESTFWNKDDYRKRKRKGILEKHDFPMDMSIARDIAKYAKVFFHMLAKEYHAMKSEEMHIPRIIRKNTEEYIAENNFSLRFIREQTIKDEDGEASIKFLHCELKKWMNDHYSGKKVPNIEIFLQELIDEGYEVKKNVVRGLVVEYD